MKVFEFCNVAMRFSVYIVWTSDFWVSTISNYIVNIKAMKLYLLNNPVPINKLTWLEPTIHGKTSSWSAVNFKKDVTLMSSKPLLQYTLYLYWKVALQLVITGKSFIISNICLLYGWILLATGNFTCGIKGKSITLSCNRCYRLQPLITALDMHVC